MSTPQDPQDPQSPQDPQDPQNPYGAPPPEQPAAPQQPPAYGQPGQPQYGQPYPQQPYGQPGQPGYPAYPQAAASNDAPKGLAITSLVLAFLGCTGILAIVSIVMAVVVLLRGKDGRNHGKGLAITAIIVSVVSLAIGGAILALGVFVSSLTDVEDLSTGDCVTATGLADDSADSVTSIKTVPCSDAHDGEVLATASLTQEQADTFTTNPSSTICEDAIVAAGKADVFTGDTVTFTALTAPDPGAGDKVACIAYNTDGSELTGTLGG